MSEKAETYIELIANCPMCDEANVVEWMDETESDYNEWSCEKCGAAFKYCHPNNNYGL